MVGFITFTCRYPHCWGALLDVVGALDDLHGNLRVELRDLDSARSQLASAQDTKAKADQAVAATQKRIDDLTAQSEGVVVDAFVNPPADTALDAMGAATAGDASVKASIVGMQHDADASILARRHGAPALAAQLKAQESEIAARLEAIRTANEQRRALEALRRA